jgi:hypothetical protein
LWLAFKDAKSFANDFFNFASAVVFFVDLFFFEPAIIISISVKTSDHEQPQKKTISPVLGHCPIRDYPRRTVQLWCVVHKPLVTRTTS